MEDEKKYILLLLDGEEPSKLLLDKFLKSALQVIATDGAARYADTHNIPIDIIIGDMDSLPNTLRKKYEEKGTRI